MENPLPLKKRKKIEEVPEIDKDIEEEIERQLQSKARKTRLTKNNVKSILRHIILNDNVLTMVQKTMNPDMELPEQEETLEEDIEPKITRSKAKELLQNQADTPWLLSPIKQTISEEHLLLIQQELPEDDDDEEYKPNEDEEHSDDETGRMSVVSILSQTSATNNSQLNESFTADITSNDSHQFPSLVIDDAYLFKTPEENICHRTRSKLCLEDTPLETIEQAFIPPDITTDMYDFECDNEDWSNFLKEFVQPLSNDTNDDDDEGDPEYNVLADEEVVDSEELRGDSAVTVTRKELRTLMAEVFECPDEVSSDEEKERRVKHEIEVEIKPETNMHSEIMIDNTGQQSEAEEEEEFEQVDLDDRRLGLTGTQILLLQQHLRQHVQFSTQHFLQTYKHPVFSDVANEAKVILTTLHELAKIKGEDSLFNIHNLEPALELVEKWEETLEHKEMGKDIIKHMEQEIKLQVKAKKKRNYHRIQFHPKLMELVVNSKVFIYPLMLPSFGFRCDNPVSLSFCTSEDQLIAIGLEQFSAYLKVNPRWYDRKKYSEKAAIELTCQYLFPVKRPETVARHIRNVKGVKDNPINYYRKHKKAAPSVHYVIPFNPERLVPPCQQHKGLLPDTWKKYLYPDDDDDDGGGGDKENNNSSTSSSKQNVNS